MWGAFLKGEYARVNLAQSYYLHQDHRLILCSLATVVTYNDYGCYFCFNQSCISLSLSLSPSSPAANLLLSLIFSCIFPVPSTLLSLSLSLSIVLSLTLSLDVLSHSLFQLTLSFLFSLALFTHSLSLYLALLSFWF